MSDCNFDRGDFVSIPAFGGVCAEVIRKEPLGTGFQLWVRLSSGQELSVSCSSVGPCSRVPRVEALNGAADADNEEETPRVERSLSFQQIDRGIRETELFNSVKPGEALVFDPTDVEPEGRLKEIGRAYEMVRPILVAMGDSPFLRTAWRHALQIYIQLMDSIFLDRRS